MVKFKDLFKALECFSSTFQGKFNFQGVFKTILYIQVLFKPVRTLDLSVLSCIQICTISLAVMPQRFSHKFLYWLAWYLEGGGTVLHVSFIKCIP